MARELSERPGADQKATDDPLKPHQKRRESGREIKAVRGEILEQAKAIAEKVASSRPPKALPEDSKE
jgi:hypothetical protein